MDYSGTNKKLTRGFRKLFLLLPGAVYLVTDPDQLRAPQRTYRAVLDGQVVILADADEIDALPDEQRRSWLAGQRAKLEARRSPPAPKVRRVEGRRTYLGTDVLTAARERIARVFDDFPRVYVSFSGGKDSTVMLHLVAEEARRRGRRFGLLFIDLEAQYRLTIQHLEEMFALYADVTEPFWVALPLSLRNAVSNIAPRWRCWDPAAREIWVREPPALAVTSGERFPFFCEGEEFEEFTPDFGHWYSQDQLTCCLVGIRTAESLNRWRAIARRRVSRYDGLPWTSWQSQSLFNAYPIYDWSTEDIWTYHARTGLPYNKLYDRMHQAGLSIHQQRICQPYGDDQRKGLWLYQVIEPETWGRVVARVAGANSGALYAQESGNILGRLRIAKPEGHTWRSFATLLLDTMPERTADHYREKISVFLRWWVSKGYPQIPDEAPHGEEAAKKAPSWRRICKALLRNDYWCKGLSFTQTKSPYYEKYRKQQRARSRAWRL
jgi:predicted phosphoadenosine phosphosulfate sulfurtransferase